MKWDALPSELISLIMSYRTEKMAILFLKRVLLQSRPSTWGASVFQIHEMFLKVDDKRNFEVEMKKLLLENNYWFHHCSHTKNNTHKIQSQTCHF